MQVSRSAANPVITPADVLPSRPDLRVVCAFNPAVARMGRQTILLLRVAEAVRDVAPDEVAVPVLRCDEHGSCVSIERIPRNAPGLDLTDSRVVQTTDRYLLSSLSHLRVARSVDGEHFTVDAAPALFPSEPYEEYGIEDPRISRIGDTYYINYSAVSRYGIAVALASTQDFATFTRHGMIFGPENKNVAIFPEAIGGRYYALHRPSSLGLGAKGMWLATSPNLLHWGNHQLLATTRPECWDNLRIGAGAAPLRIPEGWLLVYHGVDRAQGYCLGAMLLDADDPRRILARGPRPLLTPQAAYECTGFYGSVVFTCGAHIDEANRLHIYYGAADEHTCVATVPVADVLASLEPVARGVAA